MIVFAGCAGQSDPGGLIIVDPDVADSITLEELEAVGYEGDGLTIELYELMTAVDGQYREDPGFSGFEWSRDTETLTLWWYGEVPTELAERLSAHGASISQAVNPPRDLADAVERLMAVGAVPGVFISAAGASIDCSKLSITAEATDPEIGDGEMKAAIEAVAGFPVDLEVGRIVPLTGVGIESDR